MTFNSLSQFMANAYLATQNGRKEFGENIRNYQRELSICAAAAGMNESIPADGGFMVGSELVRGIMEKLRSPSTLASRCTKIPLTRYPQTTIPLLDESSRADSYRAGGARGYWRAEADSITTSKAKFREIGLVLKKLTAILPVSDEVFEDVTGLQAMLDTIIGDEFAFQLDDAILRGSGSDRPLGFLNSPALITVPAAEGQTAKTINWENVNSMFQRMWAGGRNNAVWLVNDEALPQIMSLSRPSSNGSAPVWQPGDKSGGKPDTILGHPCLPIEQASALGDVGDISFVDLSQYVIAERPSTDAVSSIHVGFNQGETNFRFIYRVDGQPLWAQPLTPYKGLLTRSPFITLAAR